VGREARGDRRHPALIAHRATGFNSKSESRESVTLLPRIEEESPGVAREGFNGREPMKKTILSIALAVVAPFAWAQTSSTTTTTTTTDGGGTITEYTPGSVITLKETSGPRHYRFGKTVTYVTKSGKTLDEETVKTRIKVGVPVHVHYTGEGDNLTVDRVILDED
jgi:hypothetical protein